MGRTSALAVFLPLREVNKLQWCPMRCVKSYLLIQLRNNIHTMQMIAPNNAIMIIKLLEILKFLLEKTCKVEFNLLPR
jgi:hypothetical protein